MPARPLQSFFDPSHAARRGRFLINLFYLLTLCALAAAAVWLTARFLLPFVAAFLTAALLQRPIRWLTARTRAPRGFLSGVLVVLPVLALTALIGGAGWWAWRAAVRLLGNEQAVAEVTATVSGAADALRGLFARLTARFSPDTQAALQAAFGDLWAQGGERLREWVGTAAGDLLRFAAGRLPGILFGFFIWAVASVLLTVDYRRVTAFLWRQLPAHRRAMAADARAMLSGAFGQMTRAYLLLMLLTFGELTAGLWLLRVPAAPLAAAVIAVVDILPVLGVGTVLIPWAAIALLNGAPRMALGLTVLYLIITLIRNVVEPRLVSEKVGLPPAVGLLCLYLGWRVAGIAGILLLPPAVTVLVQLQKRGHLPLWK